MFYNLAKITPILIEYNQKIHFKKKKKQSCKTQLEQQQKASTIYKKKLFWGHVQKGLTFAKRIVFCKWPSVVVKQNNYNLLEN